MCWRRVGRIADTPAEPLLSSARRMASSFPVTCGWLPHAREIVRTDELGGGVKISGLTIAAAGGAIALFCSVSGAPPSTHAAISATSNGDNDGSFANAP